MTEPRGYKAASSKTKIQQGKPVTDVKVNPINTLLNHALFLSLGSCPTKTFFSKIILSYQPLSLISKTSSKQFLA